MTRRHEEQKMTYKKKVGGGQDIPSPQKSSVLPLTKSRQLFHAAISTLSRLYGDEIRHSMLDGKVKLSHKQWSQLADLATRSPHGIRELADDINAGNTKQIKDFLRALKCQGQDVQSGVAISTMVGGSE
jgi:hypothetical protein